MKLNRANNINYRGGGKKGKAGRKSIREEKKAVDFLKEVFFEGFDMEKGLASEKAIIDGRGYVKFADLLAHRATKDSRLLARMFEMLVGSQEGALMKENQTNVFYQVYLPSPDNSLVEPEHQVIVVNE